MTGCSLRLNTYTRSCESHATPATSPWVHPSGSCSQLGTSSNVRLLSPTSIGSNRFSRNRARPRPVADVDDQAVWRLELGFVVDVAQADRIQLDGATGQQPLAGEIVVGNADADVLEAGP